MLIVVVYGVVVVVTLVLFIMAVVFLVVMVAVVMGKVNGGCGNGESEWWQWFWR